MGNHPTGAAGGSFEAAMQHVVARSQRGWVIEEITRTTGQGIRATFRVLRQPGGRLAWDEDW